jgi:hypothetical protein
MRSGWFMFCNPFLFDLLGGFLLLDTLDSDAVPQLVGGQVFLCSVVIVCFTCRFPLFLSYSRDLYQARRSSHSAPIEENMSRCINFLAILRWTSERLQLALRSRASPFLRRGLLLASPAPPSPPGLRCLLIRLTYAFVYSLGVGVLWSPLSLPPFLLGVGFPLFPAPGAVWSV